MRRREAMPEFRHLNWQRVVIKYTNAMRETTGASRTASPR
jgi:hypothetical protein